MKSQIAKKAYQNALMEKAARNAAMKIQSLENVDVKASTELPIKEKNLENEFRLCLEHLLADYPATGKNTRKDFSYVLSLLLKLNVDPTSQKDVSFDTEKTLNQIGFSTTNEFGKCQIQKADIPSLVLYIFEGYKEVHPSFCEVDEKLFVSCEKELDQISAKVWNPIMQYIIAQTCSSLTKEDAKHLLSGNTLEIEEVLKGIKCAEATRKVLFIVAPEMGAIINKLNLDKDSISTSKEEEVVISAPLIQKNLNDSEIISKQDQNIKIFKKGIDVLQKNIPLLREIMNTDFSVDDAKALIEFESIGFSIRELVDNPKLVETISTIATALQ